jgi:hypothetical protein
MSHSMDELLAGLDPETRAKIEAAAAALAPAEEHPFIRAARDFAAELRSLDCKPGTVQCKIDGLCYTSAKLPFSIGVELAPRVASLVGNGIMKALATGQGLEDVDLAELAALIVGVSDRAMRDGLMPIVRDLLSRMKCGALRTGGEGSVVPVMDDHFAGEYIHALKVCVFSLAHNYRGPSLGVR